MDGQKDRQGQNIVPPDYCHRSIQITIAIGNVIRSKGTVTHKARCPSKLFSSNAFTHYQYEQIKQEHHKQGNIAMYVNNIFNRNPL